MQILIRLFFISIVLALTSCATILTPNNHILELNNKNHSADVVLDSVVLGNVNEVNFKRNSQKKLLTLKQKGCIDEQYVVIPNSFSKLVFLDIPLSAVGILTDLSTGKLYKYPEEINLKENVLEVPLKGDQNKFINLTKVVIPEFMRAFTYSCKVYNSTGLTDSRLAKKTHSISSKIKYLDVVEFTKNTLLSKKYMATNNIGLTYSYENSLKLELEMKDVVLNTIHQGKRRSPYTYYQVIANLKWNITDFYDVPLEVIETNVVSGQYSDNKYYDGRLKYIIDNTNDNVLAYQGIDTTFWEELTNEIVQKGLSKLLRSDKMNSLLKIKEVDESENMSSELIIDKPQTFGGTIANSIDAIVSINSKGEQKSGYLISNDGYILTSFCSINDTGKQTVVLRNGKEYPFEIIRSHKGYNVSLIKINSKNTKALQNLLDKSVDLAQIVYCVSSSGGLENNTTLSEGIISGFRSTSLGLKVFQTDASVNYSSNGGPMLNADGEVIGLLNTKYVETGVEGIGFGFPISDVVKALNISFK
ncbi:MAG: hypothetical protein CMP61_05820 [Flavobacteriales bacterium]|nr:hypothetical protein [Flavobacteriales bacterium]|tara:strand:- start:228 stop:1820 length:1593 start_codon:yes stop_codon:yes gene_type:complete